jgi:hypothetical protein
MRPLTYLVTVSLLTCGSAVACASGESAEPEDRSAEASGALALWQVGPDQALTPATETFTALVTRLECSGGLTGEILPPEIQFGADQVVISFEAAPRESPVTQPNDDGLPIVSTCQSNPAVPYEVDLGEPLGDRLLVDGQCADSVAATTLDCVNPSATRWPLG